MSDSQYCATPQPRRRRWKPWAVVGVLIVAALMLLRNRPFDSDLFYAYLLQHPNVRTAVRPVFVVAGKESDFDFGIIKAAFQRAARNQARRHTNSRVDRTQRGIEAPKP